MHPVKAQMEELIRRLKAAIDNSEFSLRGLCEKTQECETPMRIHHSNLSMILNRRADDRHNLYLEQWLIILDTLKIPLEDFLLGKRAGAIAAALNKLSEQEQRALVDHVSNLVVDIPDAGAVRRRLNRAM